jgi:hypothetical protein
MGCISSTPINIPPHEEIKKIEHATIHYKHSKYMHTINISPSFPGQYSPRPSQKYTSHSLSNIT